MIYLVNLNQEQFIKKRSKWLPKIQVRARCCPSYNEYPTETL